jgi:hypothetical protein
VHFLLSHTTKKAFCTEKSHCHAPSSSTHGKEALSCVTRGARQKKLTDGAHGSYGVNGLCRALGMGHTEKIGAFVMHQGNNVPQRLLPLPCAPGIMHGKELHLLLTRKVHSTPITQQAE